MRIRQLLGNVTIVAFAWVTLCALLLTIFRIRILFPENLVIYSYGMMAPYQSYGLHHEEMLAEGLLPSGTWEVIDLAPYYPVLFGERNVREYFAMFSYTVDPARRNEFRERYARRLLELEKKKGKPYAGVRLSWQTWPNMTGDFRANKFPAQTTLALMAEVYDE